jgi:hypothetical protein
MITKHNSSIRFKRSSLKISTDLQTDLARESHLKMGIFLEEKLNTEKLLISRVGT